MTPIKISVKYQDFITALTNIRPYYKRNKNQQIILFWNENTLIVGFDTREFLAMQKIIAKAINFSYKTNYDFFYYQLFDGIQQLQNIIPLETIITLEFTNNKEVKIYSEADNKLLQILATNKKEIYKNLIPSDKELFDEFLENKQYNKTEKFQLHKNLNKLYFNEIINTYGIKSFIPKARNKNKKEKIIGDIIELYINKSQCNDVVLTTTSGGGASCLIMGDSQIDTENYIRLLMPTSLVPFTRFIINRTESIQECYLSIKKEKKEKIFDISFDTRIIINGDLEAAYPNVIGVVEKFEKHWKTFNIDILDLDILAEQLINPIMQLTKTYNNRIFTNIKNKNNNELEVSFYYEKSFNQLEEIKVLQNNDNIEINNPNKEKINIMFNTRLLYYLFRMIYFLYLGKFSDSKIKIMQDNEDSSRYAILNNNDDVWYVLMYVNKESIKIKG